MEPTTQRIRHEKMWQALGLTDSEYDMIVQKLGRHPNWTELGLFSALWSEHCAYKHTRGLFHLFPTEGEHILEGPGENAGIVDIGDGLAAVFKIESHNSPSAIDPYEGAATGVGGILRDIFAMGARPVAVLNSLRFGPLTHAKDRELFAGVVKGIAGYSAGVDVPTVGGEVFFDPTYSGRPLVNAMAVGIVTHDGIARAQAAGVGNPVIVVGALTGRDGIHGASFSSAAVAEQSAENLTMQVSDPETGKRLIEATLEAIATGLVVGVQDMGAAGLTSSAAEMADRAGTGLELDVSQVPCREQGMTPFEIMLSESQERMLMVPKQGAEQQLMEIFAKYQLPAAVIGRVTDDRMFRIVSGHTVAAEIPVEALSSAGAPKYNPPKKESEHVQALRNTPWSGPADDRWDEALLTLLGSPTIASKAWAYSQFALSGHDHMVTRVGDADAAVIRVGNGQRGLALSVACNARYVYLNPYRGAAIAVAEAARNVSCVGGEPVAITDGLNFGSPEKPDVYWQLDQAIRGIADACRALDTPVTGGNASLYNEKDGKSLYPTPIIGVVGLVDDVNDTVSSAWVEAGDAIVLLGETRDELGGSEYAAVNGFVGGDAPQIDLGREKAVQSVCRQLIRQRTARSAHDCSEGGLAVTLAEACIQSQIGASVQLTDDVPNAALLFGETQSRIILSMRPDHTATAAQVAAAANVPFTVIGTVGGDTLHIERAGAGGKSQSLLDVAVSRCAHVWHDAIPQAMQAVAPSNVEGER